jgi:hypothetical protein
MKNKFNPKRAILLLIIALLFVVADNYQKRNSTTPSSTTDNTSVEQAFLNKQESVQVSGNGTVVKLLPDDLKGARHQKFILKISKNLTILIAHNIDLAPKIKTLKKGDLVLFTGEYEYNNRGGLVHWTHHDPGKRHPEGWLKHNGKTYK